MTRPHSACEQDASLDERLALPIEQGVLLWCMRMWVVQLKHGEPAQSRIGEMLDALGILSAAPALEGFMQALSQGCTRMIEVQCVCRKRISADERVLLDALSLAQALRPFEALLLLRGFVTQPAAERVLRSAERIGTALAGIGRFLPEPEDEVRHFALSAAPQAAVHGAPTLH